MMISPSELRPLHNQILIKPLPIEDSPGSLVIMPESAKKSTVQSGDGKDRINYVLAEVIAVGSGRKRVDADLIPDMVTFLQDSLAVLGAFLPSDPDFRSLDPIEDGARSLLKRLTDSAETIALDVKPGDKILYHPSVRNFDRSVYIENVEHFIIGEHSLLAIVESPGENLCSRAEAGATSGEPSK